jgi:hypothetical protein
VLTLAVAIAFSCIAIALVLYGVEQLLEANAREAALRQIGIGGAAPTGAGPAPTPAPSAPVAASRPAAAPAASAAASTPRPDEDAERRQLAALEAEMKQRAREAAEQAAAEAARRKERAWERYYQRPAFCSENPTSAQLIECANQHIRARRQFEELWASGRLGRTAV